jgi:D-alanine-D-alanine ligase-like ATP-grasp enzyme
MTPHRGQADQQASAPPQHQVLFSTLGSLPFLPTSLHAFSPSGTELKNLDSALLAEAARGIGLLVQPLSSRAQVIVGSRVAIGFVENLSSTLTALDLSLSKDLLLTRRVLQSNGIPVPTGQVAANLNDAIDLLRRFGPPIVVRSIAVTGKSCAVDSEEQLRRAFARVLGRRRRVYIESHRPSVELRIMVVGAQAVAALLILPASVIGDGDSTIADLIRDKNVLRTQNPYLRQSRIRLDAATERYLADIGLTASSVPEAGQRIFLGSRAVRFAGAETVSVTDQVHQKILLVAERAAEALSTSGHAGVTMLVENLVDAPEDQWCVVTGIDLNHHAAMHEFPAFGEPVGVGIAEIRSYFALDRPSSTSRDINNLAGPRTRRNAFQALLWSAVQHFTPSMPECNKLAGEVAGGYPSADVARLDVASPRELDRLLMKSALRDLGFSKIRYRGSRIHARRGGKEEIFDRNGATVFATEVASDRGALEILLTDAGVPICRHVRFERGQLEQAKKLVNKVPGPWTLRAETGGESVRVCGGLRTVAALESAWMAAANAGEIVLEQASDCHAWKVLMLAGEVAACVAVCPPTVVGDGRTSVGQLIERRRATRDRHPLLRHYATARLSNLYLTRLGLNESSPLERGGTLTLGSATSIDRGADTVSYTRRPHAGLAAQARHVLTLLGNPPIAAVTFFRRQQRRHHAWIVAALDVDPLLGEFALPLAGPTNEIYGRVARLLQNQQNYRLS